MYESTRTRRVFFIIPRKINNKWYWGKVTIEECLVQKYEHYYFGTELINEWRIFKAYKGWR